MNNQKIAVIGCGYWGKNLVRNFHALNALGAVCDTSQENIDKIKSLHPDCAVRSLDEILSDPKIGGVAIATPAETHNFFLRKALNAGKDVFVEKPLCLSPTEGEELIELARKKERILMVGHLLWYHPAVLALQKMIRAGELGRIHYIYSNRLNFGKIRREENILWSFAPHDISVILGLLGEMPDAVQAQGGNYLHQQIADITVSMLSFPSGVKAHIFVSWLHPSKEQKLIVVGDKKMAVFDDVEVRDKLRLYPHKINWKNNIPIPNKAEAVSVPIDATEPLYAECLHFLECMKNRTEPRTDGREGLRVLTVLQQCQAALGAKSAGATTMSGNIDGGYFAHESAFIDNDVAIGAGTSIWHVSHIMKGTKLGKHCRIGQNVVIGPRVQIGDGVKIQNNVSVYEGVTLEDHVFCGPSMVFTNVYNPRSEVPRMQDLRKTLVKQGATLGANCTIVCGVTIGRYSFVGAGTVITRDIPDYAMAVGNPAVIKGWMCQCGEKLDISVSPAHEVTPCHACGAAYKMDNDCLTSLS